MRTSFIFGAAGGAAGGVSGLVCRNIMNAAIAITAIAATAAAISTFVLGFFIGAKLLLKLFINISSIEFEKLLKDAHKVNFL
jgi:hypothetical protein